MSSLSEILASYRQLAATLARMVELARARQWEHLAALDAQCTSLADQLQRIDLDHLSPAGRARVGALASRIRADQAHLTDLLRPQFVHLMRSMGQKGHGQDPDPVRLHS